MLIKSMFEPQKRSEFLRYWSVPLFLLVIAGIHMYRVHAYNQSSWGAGCGFGMFASVDYHDTRFFGCEITASSKEKLRAFFQPGFKNDLAARVVPSAFNVSRLANNLSEQQWFQVSIYRNAELTHLIESIASTDRTAKKYIEMTYDQLDVFTKSKPIDINEIELSLYGVKFDLAEQNINSHLLSKVSLYRKNPTHKEADIRETVY